MAPSPVYVIGVGMTKFVKPRGSKIDYPDLGFEAGIKALNDASVNYDDIEQGVACYAYGDSTCGQRVFYRFGMTGIPIHNVNNNCSTGSTGIFLAQQMCAGGTTHVFLVVGFEKMFPGSLQTFFKDRASPLDKTMMMMAETNGIDGKAPAAAQLFGNGGREYMQKYGATKEDFAEIARVNHEHSQRNPYSQFRDVYTHQEILSSPKVWDPLTKLQCCPTSDGAAAAVIVSQSYLDSRPELRSRAILIAGQSMATDTPALYSRSAIDLVGFSMTQRAARAALTQAQTLASDIKLVELHDCFSTNELLTIDALGLCPPGEAHNMVRAGDITYGGRCLINPSGGLISKGHPLGATGLAQAAELVWQLRGWAGDRGVPGGVDVALQHNLGLGGAAVVTVYKRADGGKGIRDDTAAGMIGGRGYNPAVEARGVTSEEIENVVSKKARSGWIEGKRSLDSRL